jgi:hypothetical protein
VEIVEERSLGRGFGTIILNGCMIAWLYGSRYGTTGKDTKLDITNQKECSKPVLLITRIQLTLLPISPLPHLPIAPVWNMQNGWLGIPYYQQFVEFPLH